MPRRPVARLLALFALVAGLFLFSGCTNRFNVDIVIHDETNIHVAATYGYPVPQSEQFQSPCALFLWQSKKSTDDGNWVGCQASGRFTLEQVAGAEPHNLTHQGGVWSFQVKADKDKDITGAMTAKDFQQFHVSVTFPGPVLTHSGSSTVSGTTVTWSDPQDFVDGLQATAKDGSGHPIWPWLVGAGTVLPFLALGVWLLLDRRKASTARA